MADRKSIRDQIFANAKVESKEVEFFGTIIELRQPSMRRIMELQALEDRARGAAMMIVNYAYVPGTDERVFDEADLDALIDMPFGHDMSRVNTAIAELTDVQIMVDEAKGNSEKAQDDSTSSS